jgi:hypothetical protein
VTTQAFEKNLKTQAFLGSSPLKYRPPLINIEVEIRKAGILCNREKSSLAKS